MCDRYCVFGNPVAHSKSPRIHTAFSKQCGQNIEYTARLIDADGEDFESFAAAVRRFAAEGGHGANVTVPFKALAFRLADELTERAQAAQAVNTLSLRQKATGLHIKGDNTDGVGLLQDLTGNLGCEWRGKRLLLLGAGGAARGVLAPLLSASPAALVIANRTPAKATALATLTTKQPAPAVCTLAELADWEGEAFDLVINATAASLTGEIVQLSNSLFKTGSLAYDLMYSQHGQKTTPFLDAAHAAGVSYCADGLGMLVEQAAEAFYLWRGVRPQTQPVLKALGRATIRIGNHTKLI